MNFSELKTEVFRRLNEDSVSPDFWTEVDIETAINEGYMELSDASEWHESNLPIQLLSNRTYYDLRALVGTDFLAPRRAFNTTTNRWLGPTHVRDLDLHTYRKWETITGEPEDIFLRGLWWLGIFPKKNSDDSYLKFFFISLPRELEISSDKPKIPEKFQQALIEYALFDLLAQEAETTKAIMHLEQYFQLEQEFIVWVNSRVKTDKMNVGQYE